MNRREFGALLGSALLSPLSTAGQQPSRTWRIACLITGSPESHGAFVAAFRGRLAEMRYVEGRDVVFDLRWAAGQVEQLPALAAELAGFAPDLIVTATSAAAVAANRVMPEIPIVSATLVDPIGTGLVATLARPGGNVTGMSLVSFETLLGKQLEFAREVLPDVRNVGMLVNTRNPAALFQRDSAQAAAPRLGVTLISADIVSPEDLNGAFDALAGQGSEIVLVLTDALFITERRRIAALALAAHLPTISGIRDMAEAGAFVSYGTDLTENWLRAAYFVDRIIRGARPANLPVEQPTKYQLVVNLKTANALRLAIPAALLAGADEVIE
jgi:putative ABC transport system substrate-binding protein